MPGNLRNFLNAFLFGKFLRFQKFLLEFDGGVLEIFQKFPKYLGIWEIYQMCGYLGISPNALIFWEIPQISSYLRNLQNLKNIPPSNSCMQEFGKFREFPKCLGIWEICQIPIFFKSIIAVGSWESCKMPTILSIQLFKRVDKDNSLIFNIHFCCLIISFDIMMGVLTTFIFLLVINISLQVV